MIWEAKALCKGRAELFDPPISLKRADRAAREAQALGICATCPGRSECRAWVMGLPPIEDPGGVCGGLTEAERAQLRPGLLMTTDTLKQCRTCWEWKRPADYSPDKRSSDGLQSYCKPCIAERMRDSRHQQAVAS